MHKARLENLFVKEGGNAHAFSGRRIVGALMHDKALRRIINISTIVFLLMLTVALVAHLTALHREQVSARQHMSLLLVKLAADELGRELVDGGGTWRMPVDDDLKRALPEGAEEGRLWLVADAGGVVRAAWPKDSGGGWRGKRLEDVLPSVPVSGKAGEPVKRLLDIGERRVMVAAVALSPWPGTLLVVEELPSALSVVMDGGAGISSLFLLTAVMILALAAAYNWQSTQADNASRALAVATSRLDAALDRGRCGLWDWDVARGRIFWSHSMYSMLGMEAQREYLSYGEIAARQHPQDMPMEQLAESMLANGENSFDYEFRMRHEDGHWVWLRARGALVEGGGGEAPHLVGIAIDISRQKLADKANKEAETRLRDAIETIAESFVLWDAESRLVMCNSKYRQFHSLPVSICQPGTPYEEVMKAARKPKVKKRHSIHCDESGEEVAVEVQLADGRWVQISERRTRDRGFVSVGTDITDLKRQQERLRQSEEELKATIDELEKARMEQEQQKQRLADLVDRYLRASEEAQEASRAKSEFLAAMSHELRTPLNPIIGFAQAMQAQVFGPLPEKYAEYARDIERSAAHMAELVNDILDMSKIEAGKVELAVEESDLAAIARQAMEMAAGDARAKGVKLEGALPSSMALMGDPLRLRQVVLNILSNAVKFTPEGGMVKVSGEVTDGEARLVISDTGIGIPEDQLKNICKPFVQVASQFSRGHGGSGLGLAISLSLVKMHGGRLEIDSREGEGTRVTISLPALAEEQGAAS